MKKINLKTAIVAILVAVILIGTVVFISIQGEMSFSFNGNYAFDVEIKDPSFSIVGLNHTELSQLKIRNYTYTSTSINVQVNKSWNVMPNTNLFQMVNTLHHGVNVTVSDNFTQGIIFTYYVLNSTQTLMYGNIMHESSWEATWHIDNSTRYVNQLITANTTSDPIWESNYHPHRANMTFVAVTLVGDGTPILNTTNIHANPGQDIFISLGNYNYTHAGYFRPGNYTADSVLQNIAPIPTNESYVSGSIKI